MLQQGITFQRSPFDFGQDDLLVGDGVGRVGLDVVGRKKLANALGRMRREDRNACRCDKGRNPGAQQEARVHDLVGTVPGDTDQFIAIHQRHKRAFLRGTCEPLKKRFDDPGQLGGVQIGGSQPQHLGHQPKAFAVGFDVAQIRQHHQVPARR